MRCAAMKRRFFLSVLVLLCSMLSGCDFFVTENSDPDTADEVAAHVNDTFRAYGTHVVPESMQVGREKPFQKNVYALYDEGIGIHFTCTAEIRRAQFPYPFLYRDTDAAAAYAEAYFAHLYPKVCAITSAYHLTAASPEEAEELRKSNGTSAAEPLFGKGDFIFLHDARGADVVHVCRELHALYRPQGDDTLLAEAHGRRVTFYDLPEGTKDRRQAVQIMTFYLSAKQDWAATLYENPGHSSGEKDTAVLEECLARYFEVRLKSAKAYVRDHKQ